MPHKPFSRTLRAQWLGDHLRELREQRELSLDLVATYLNRDRSALGRYERATWPIQRHDTHALLDLYGFHDATARQRLLAVADEVWRTDRWDRDSSEVDHASFIDLPWLESRAESICSYHCQVIPGLFQLPEYAELVIRCAEGPTAPATTIARGLARRMERQKLLERNSRPEIEAVIDETALRRQIGGPAVHRAQLAHLGALARRPGIELRVLPSRVALHPGLDGSFWLFRMPEPYPPVAYQENRAGHFFLETPKSDGYQDAYDRIREATLGPAESAELITFLGEDLS